MKCKIILECATHYLTNSHIWPPLDNQGSPNTPKIWGPFFLKKRRLRQRTHKLGASKNMGAIFLKKKALAAT